MRFVIFILALGGTVSALDGGSSVWFYSDEKCAPINATKDKGDQIYSRSMDIDRRTCWKNEKDGVKHGARRRSIWIDKPVQANKADENKTQGCLWLWSNGKCGGDPSATMTFTQSRDNAVCYTFDPVKDGHGGVSGYASYEISDGACTYPLIGEPDHFIIPKT